MLAVVTDFFSCYGSSQCFGRDDTVVYHLAGRAFNEVSLSEKGG